MLPTVTRVSKSKTQKRISRQSYAAAAPVRAPKKSFLEQQRIKHNKRFHAPPLDTDAPYLAWPYKRLGCDTDINYELSAYGVAPCGENAYRNLHLRHLMMKTPGKVDANKALHIEGKTAKNHKVIFSESPFASYHLSQDLPSTGAADFKKLMGNISRHLSTDTKDLYLCDGGIGSHKKAEANVRLITSDAQTAFYLRHMLNATPVGVRDFQKNIYVLHAPDYVLESPEKYGLPKGLESFTSMMLINGETIMGTLEKRQIDRISKTDQDMLKTRETGIIIIGGTRSFSTLRSALSTIADHVHLKNNRLPVEGTIFTEGDKSALVFDSEGLLVAGGLNSSLFSVQNSVIGNNTAYRYYQGATHANTTVPRTYGDLVENFGKVSQVTQTIPVKNLHTAAPSSIVFLVNDSTLPTVGKVLTSDAALKVYKSGYSGKASNPYYIKERVLLQPKQDSLATAFDTFLKSSNAQVYVINTATAGNDLQTILKAVVSGAAATAQVTPLTGIQIGSIQKLGGKSLSGGDSKATKSLGEKLGISA